MHCRKSQTSDSSERSPFIAHLYLRHAYRRFATLFKYTVWEHNARTEMYDRLLALAGTPMLGGCCGREGRARAAHTWAIAAAWTWVHAVPVGLLRVLDFEAYVRPPVRT